MIYMIDKVLLLKELFKAQADTSMPAPAPDVTVDSPKPSSKKAPSSSDEVDTSSSTDNVVDQVADQNAVVRFDGARFGSLILCVWWIVKTML